MKPLPLFDPPIIERRATLSAGTIFQYAGRPLLIVKVYGDDPAAPVIVEELVSFGPSTLKGQLGLWGAEGVARIMAQQVAGGIGVPPAVSPRSITHPLGRVENRR